MKEEKLCLNIDKPNYVIYRLWKRDDGEELATLIRGPYAIKSHAEKHFEELKEILGIDICLVEYTVTCNVCKSYKKAKK